MAITYVGGQTAQITASTATNTTITFSLTGGSNSTPAYGDLVVVSYAVGSTVDRNNTMITSGYTQVANISASDSYDANLAVWWKRMPLVPDTTVVVGPTLATTDGGAVTVQVFGGVSPTLPLVFTAATATGTNGSAVNPAATGTAPGAGCIGVLIGGAAAAVNLTFTAAYLTNFRQQASAATTNRTQIGAGYIAVTSGASYDGAAWTPSSTANTMSWAAVTLLLQPQNVITSYSNDFEAGNLTTNIVTSYTGSSIATGQGQGTYSAAVAMGSTTSFGVVPTDSFSSTSFYSRTYFKINKTANPTVAAEVFGPCVRYNPGASIVETRFNFDTAGVINMRLSNAIQNAYMLFPGPTITTDVWHVLEFDVIVNGTSSTFTARLDDVQIVTSTTQNFSNAVAIGQDILALGYTNGPSGTIYYDALEYSTTALPTVTLAPVTGVSATGEVGSVTTTTTTNVLPTGVTATGGVGQIAFASSTSVSVSGLEATGGIGQITFKASAPVPVSGLGATGVVGTATAAAGAETSVAGLTATSAVGQVDVSGHAHADVTGVFATGSVGQVDVSGHAHVYPESVTASTSVGTATAFFPVRVDPWGVIAAAPIADDFYTDTTGSVAVLVTGVSASAAGGAVTATGDANAIAVSLTATGQVGTVVGAAGAKVSVTGLTAAGAVGQVTVSGHAHADTMGVFATGQTGTVTVNGHAHVDVSDVPAFGYVGSVLGAAGAGATVTGLAAAGEVGSVTTINGTGVLVNVTGLSATGEVDAVTVFTNVVVLVTGLEATATVGDVTIYIRTPVYVVGVQANGYVSQVLVWGVVIPGQDPNYIPLGPAQTPFWVDISCDTTSVVIPTGRVDPWGVLAAAPIADDFYTDQTRNVPVYTDVVPAQSPSYTPVDPDQDPDWSVVAA